jgi:hypothetical protein
MTSVNNIYPEFSDKIYSRWMKTTVCAVAGVRLNPHDLTERITFLLRSDEDNFDIEKKEISFSYETDVLEIYDPIEVRMFAALNKAIMVQGLLAPYLDTPKPIDMSNVYSDADIQAIVTMKKPELLAKLETITTWATMGRIAAQLKPTDPKWKHDAVTQKLSNLAK